MAFPSIMYRLSVIFGHWSGLMVASGILSSLDLSVFTGEPSASPSFTKSYLAVTTLSHASNKSFMTFVWVGTQDHRQYNLSCSIVNLF